MDMQGTNGADFGARGSRRYIVTAVEASLRRLDTDYIDLLQYHTPDPLTPIEETLAALDQLITDGKVRYIDTEYGRWQQLKPTMYKEPVENALSRTKSLQSYGPSCRTEVLPARTFGMGAPYFAQQRPTHRKIARMQH